MHNNKPYSNTKHLCKHGDLTRVKWKKGVFCLIVKSQKSCQDHILFFCRNVLFPQRLLRHDKSVCDHLATITVKTSLKLWPEHPIAQCGAQGGWAKVGDVPSVKTLFSQRDADYYLLAAYVQQDLREQDNTSMWRTVTQTDAKGKVFWPLHKEPALLNLIVKTWMMPIID